MIIVGTGHRPDKLWNIYDIYDAFYIALGRQIRTILIKEISMLSEGETLTVVSGVALGFDTLIALVTIKLRDEYPSLVRLHCAIPCTNHGSNWFGENKKRYENIIARADVCTYTTKGPYTSFRTMYKRDEFMVDLLDNERGYVISLWNGFKSGGTYHTIEYATSKNIKVVNLKPQDYKK